MSANVQYSLPDGDMSLHISDALMANSASTDLATHIKDDPAIKLGRSSDYHLKTRSKTSVFNCDVCERSFESAEYLSSHVLSHSLDIGAYSCEICHKVFHEKHDLAQHKCLQSTDMHSQNLIHNANTFHPQTDVPRANMNGPYVCMTGIGNSGDGENPMDPDYNLGLKGMQLFNCEYCEKKFKTNSALLIHRRSHTGETPYPCEFCGKSFRQSAHLDVHMRIHTGEMPYKCAYCDKSFTQKNNRNRHQMLHLNPNGQEPSPVMLPSRPLNENCLNSTPTAPTIGNMSSEAPRHLMNSYDNPSITQQPPPLPPPPPPPSLSTSYSQPNPSLGSMQFTYTCSICQKVYSNNSALSQHMQTHNKETSFDCYVCNHKFKQRAHLETHLRVHTHEMPYKCQYCDKRFSQKGNKNRHERLHLVNDNADMSGTLPPPPPSASSSSSSSCTSLSSSVPMETTINSAKNCIQQPNIYIDSEFASCDICHKQFFSKDDLHTHRNTHHSLSGDSSMNNTINMNSSQAQMNTSPYGPPYSNISPDKNYHVKEAPQVHYTPNKPMIVDPNSTSPASNMANKTYYEGGNVRMQESLIRQGDSDCCNVNPSHPSPCEVCGQDISCQQDMLQHTQCHKGVFTCEYCPKEFRSNSALLVHRRVHTGETPYKCDFCDKGFKQAPHLDVHLRTHTGEMPFQCLYCDKKFSQNSNKNRHQRSHFLGETSSGFNSPAPMNPSSVNQENDQENSYNLKCELCGCMFSDRNSFVNHMLSHQSLSENTGVMPADNQKTPTHGLTHLYQCMICNASFSCQPSLDNHIAVAHNNKSGPTPCNSDNMQFGPQQTHDDYNNMRSNQRRTTDYVNMPTLGTSSEISNSGHTGDGNNYMPPQNNNNYYDMRNSNIENSSSTNVSGENEGSLSCQESYGGGYGLNREPVVNMNCEFCQKNFKSVSSLMIHRRVHTGETPFECSFCQRGFKQNAHLEVHMRTHTGETPYKCEFCDKRFSQKSNRDRHQRTHLVDAVSLQNSNMDFPMENLEGKDSTSPDQSSDRYKCDICSSVFSNHDDFTDHRSCHDIPCFSEDSSFHRQQNRRKYDNMDNNPHPSRAQDGGEGGVYKCDLCGCYYSNISDLRHHQSSQHSQSSYHQGDTPRNGPEGSSSQYPVDVDSYNYQPEAKRYRSERNYSHQSSGYQDNEGSRMAGSVSRPNTSFHGRSETNYMRPEDNSYCEMGNNYCSTSKKHGHHQTLPHHGDLGSTSSKGGDEMSGSGPHACNFCQRSFRSMSALLVHRKVHTEEDPYQCDYCNKCFKQDAHHDVHMHSHAGETSFECDLCDKQFMQNSNHNHHQQKHLDNTVGMQGQVDMHNREASYRCDVCPSEFRNQEQFMDHRSCHDIPQKYEDSVNQNIATPRRGRRRTSVKNYVEIDDDEDFNHDDDRPVNDGSTYGCNQCDENCMGLNERQRHNAKKNESHRLAPPLSTSYRDTKKYSSYRGDSYQCEICFQKFYKEEELCQHRLVHMTNPHVGDKNKAYSPHHNAAVTSKYSDPCTVGIDKEDGSYGNMNHKITGNPCELCCKIFSSTSALTTHMRVHTGEAPFKCDFCHRAFKQTAHLEVHMRVHTGEMPFKCHYCEKRFTQKNNMLRHEKIHHGDASGHRNSMAMDVESLDSHCQTCEAQCQEQTHIPDPHQPKCPSTPDSVSNCDICCKDSSVKPDLCQYSEPRHHNSHHQKRSSCDNGQKMGRGNYEEKSTLDSKDQIQTYDCCQDSCLESFHDNPELENKASDYSIQSDMAPVESLALQLPYACRHCKIEFLNQEDLCDHEPQCEAANIVPPGASSKFPLLNNTENEAVYLDETHGLSNVHQCEFCQKVFKSFSSLSVHRRVHTGEAPFQCHFCQRRFKQNSHLEVHLRTHTDEAPYKCEFCDKCFTQAGNRNRHQRTHFMDAVSLAAADFEMLEQEEPNIEGQSSEGFVEGQDYELEREIPNPTENDDDDDDDQGDNDLGQIDQSIEDNEKSGTTSGEAEMMTEQKTKRKRGRPKGSRSYFKIERNPSPETVKIEIDDDITLDEKLNPSSRPRTRSLSNRIRNSCSKKPSSQTETPEASFNCSVCSLVFSSVEELSRHQDSAKHVNDPGQSTENGSFTCEYCDKTFTNGSALAVHRRVHTGEAPFQCQYCPKSFKQNAHLDVHMRIHTGEMPFQCAFCDKRFTQNCNRLRHQKTHFTNVTSGENGVSALSSDAIETSDFKCELCNQEFDTKHMFDNHVCVDNSYNDDLQPLLPLQDNSRQSAENKISVPDKESLESVESLEREGFEKSSNDSSKAATSEYLKSNKWIKEEKSPQKDFGHFQQIGTTEEQGDSSCDENPLDMDEASSEKRDGSELKYGNFSCDFCSRTFRSQSALLNHRRIHTGETPYQCKYCSKSFKQVAHLDTHLRVHTGEKPYECKYCKKTFTQKSNRNRHEQVHEMSGKDLSTTGSVPEYRCELCDGYFANAADLDMHHCTMTAADEWSSHAGDTDISADSQNLPYTCNICGKEYSSRIRYEKHRQTHEQGWKEENMSPLMERNGQSTALAGSDQGIFNCEVCRQKFTDKTEYTDHIFMHISENPYQQNKGSKKSSKIVPVDQIREVCYLCEICQNEFYSTNEFTNHVCLKNMANGKEPMNRSQNSENLESAEYNNDDVGSSDLGQSEDYPGDYPGDYSADVSFYNCDYCEKSFKNHSTMLIHRRVHTGEMPFKCKFCERCFKQNAHLEVHLRTHTGETPFHCRFCEKSFTQKSNRNRHERTHLMNAEGEGQPGDIASFEDNLHCHTCSIDFPTEEDLKEHLMTHPDNVGEGPGFQPIGSYLTTLKEEQEMYERATASTNHYPSGFNDTYPESTSMANLNDMEAGRSEEDPHVMTSNKLDSSGQFYECEFCHKQLKSLSSLIIHRRVHTGEAPFRCKYCDRSFKQSAHLDVHMRTHTGETPHQCDFWDKSFTQNSNRLRHQRLHFMDATSLSDDSGGAVPLTGGDFNDSGAKDQSDILPNTS